MSNYQCLDNRLKTVFFNAIKIKYKLMNLKNIVILLRNRRNLILVAEFNLFPKNNNGKLSQIKGLISLLFLEIKYSHP